MPFDFGTLGQLLKQIDPQVAAHAIPKTGNPILDAGIRLLTQQTLGQPLSPVTASPFPDFIAARMFLIQKICEQEHGVYMISGPRGSGKSSFSLYLAQEMRRPTFAVNMPRTLSWVRKVDAGDIESLPDRSVIILDDSGLIFSSSDYHAKVSQMLHFLIPIVRHREITLIANTQSTSLVDKYLLDCDALFLKRPSMLLMEVERPVVRKLLQRAIDAFGAAGLSIEQEKAHIYGFSDYRFRFEGLLQYPMPEGYTDSISRNKS